MATTFFIQSGAKAEQYGRTEWESDSNPELGQDVVLMKRTEDGTMMRVTLGEVVELILPKSEAAEEGPYEDGYKQATLATYAEFYFNAYDVAELANVFTANIVPLLTKTLAPEIDKRGAL